MKRLANSNKGIAIVWTMASLILALGAGGALATPTIEWIPAAFPLDLSSDGTVVAGNTVEYETFRWTSADSTVRLGMNPADFGLGGAGTPDISEDGTRISATIITADTTMTTQGLWTKGVGWQRSMPPIPESIPGLEEGTVVGLGNGLASCWGLSGDGTTLTGFVWTSGGMLGSARGNTWSEADGVVVLEQPVTSYRVNDADYDADVCVGWSERFDGVWCPTVWENGTYTILHDSGWFTEAEGVSADGNTIWGNAYDPATGIPSAAIWQRTETGWSEQILGVLAGTFAGFGQAMCRDMTDDGSMIVGYNRYDQYNATGFIWTLEQGLMKAQDFLEAEGAVFPAGFVISDVAAVSDNGLVVAGVGYNPAIFPQEWMGFLVHRDHVSPVPEVAAANGVRIEGNYPNPFNPSTKISLSLDRDQSVSLGVYDVAGHRVAELFSGSLEAGRTEFTWNGQMDSGVAAASGVYFARARTEDGETLSRRMMLVK